VGVVIAVFLLGMLGHRLILPCLVGLVTELQALPRENNITYDEAEAKMFASLCSASYESDVNRVLDWTCRACKDSKLPLTPGKIKIIDAGAKNASRTIVGKLSKQNGCLVAFRGSSNVMNWLRDFQIWDIAPTTYEHCVGCKVHSGFYYIWQNVRHSVVKALKEVGCSPSSNNADNVLYVTGHSLGAAVTHLAMFTLKHAGFNVVKAYSFEAPRVGNKAFADAFSEQFTRKFPVFRITHSQDPIVHLPSANLGYTHVQDEIHYDKNGKYKLCPNVEDRTCADQYWNLPGMLLFHTADHCCSPLVPNGAICFPAGCVGSEPFMV